MKGIIPVVAAVVLDGHERVLLAQRPKGDPLEFKWEFPGGKLRKGETPEACLSRELREELGIDVEIGDVFEAVNYSYGEKDVLLLAYICRWRGGEILLKEHMDYAWVEPSKILELDLAGADLQIAKKVRDFSISCDNCWQSFYKLK